MSKLKELSLISPLHLKLISDGHGEFPDSYKLTDKGVEYLEEAMLEEYTERLERLNNE